jgi:hypothetical protein
MRARSAVHQVTRGCHRGLRHVFSESIQACCGLERILEDVVIVPAFDELTLLDPVQADAETVASSAVGSMSRTCLVNRCFPS